MTLNSKKQNMDNNFYDARISKNNKLKKDSL